MPLHYHNHQVPKEKRKNLRIIQVNVRRGEPANDLALALAFEEEIDILLIQEPWIAADLEKRLSKRNKSYQAYTPGEEWKEPPRVIQYVRRQTSLRSVEKRQDILKITDKMPHILVLEVQLSIDKEPVYIINSFNAPIGSKRVGRSVYIMMEVRELLYKRLLTMRDFNLHYNNLDNGTVIPTAQAKGFADWIAKKDTIYEQDVRTLTNAWGGAVDFVIDRNSVSEKVTECYIEPNLNGTSDHKTILTGLEMGNQDPKKPSQPKFQLDKTDEKQFFSNLEAKKDLIQSDLAQAESFTAGDSSKTLDKNAKIITIAIFSSLELSTQKSSISRKKESWWDEECRTSLQKMRHT